MVVQKLLLCLAFCLNLIGAENPTSCKEWTSCRDCIRDPTCKWCSADNFTMTGPDTRTVSRCMAYNAGTDCPTNHTHNPKGFVEYVADNDFSSDTLVKPQFLNITLRPSEVQTFNFSFKAPQNHPVDLYFLFDASNTMSAILKATANASENVYKEMRNKTENVLLGMGIFIDKNVAPFLRDKKKPISSFSHKLNMTEDFAKFRMVTEHVAENPTENADGPEGGFDALAQVITCKEHFGWRKESRKFIFFFTDATSHTAGDAKFAGIFYPYDGKCYTENETYAKQHKLDYPSIGMISELAANEGVTIIFIVENKLNVYYKQMEQQIYGSKSLTYMKMKDGSIKFDDTNADNTLEKVIRKNYEEITQNIQLEVIIPSEHRNNIEVTFDPDCTKAHEGCEVQQNLPKTVNANVKLLRYDGKDSIKIEVRIAGVKEYLTLNVGVVDCDCETEINSPYCSGNGTKKCGVCECNDNRSGRKCECKNDAKDNNMNDIAKCLQPGVRDALPCSGVGDCECGVCSCWDGYAGNYCECSSNSGVKMCNGHGTYYCGVCTCEKNWRGDSCQCPVSCKNVNNKECNNRGSCNCGRCVCEPPADWDARQSQNYEICQMRPCDTCHLDQCSKLRDCAVCRQGSDENSCTSLCKGIRVKVVDALGDLTENARICEKEQAKIGCYTGFQYQYDDDSYTIDLLVPAKADCLENYFWMGGGILAALLVIGLLTIVGWKLLTDARDRREYQRFLRAHDPQAQGCLNPIYESAVTTIPNPAFRKPSVDYTLR